MHQTRAVVNTVAVQTKGLPGMWRSPRGTFKELALEHVTPSILANDLAPAPKCQRPNSDDVRERQKFPTKAGDPDSPRGRCIFQYTRTQAGETSRNVTKIRTENSE